MFSRTTFTLKAYPISLKKKTNEIVYGGKLILPPSILHNLSTQLVEYPILLRISDTAKTHFTHAGILEFTAEEGRAYLPSWMFTTLQISSDTPIKISIAKVPRGNFVRFKPITKEFFDLSNPKIVLEMVLKHYATLTVGDTFEFLYLQRIYKIFVQDCKPEKAISVIETDLTIEFYVDSTPSPSIPDEQKQLSSSGFSLGGSDDDDEEDTSDVITQYANEKEKETPFKGTAYAFKRRKKQ